MIQLTNVQRLLPRADVGLQPPGVTTGQNAALDDAGWGSTGSGYRGGHDAVVEGAEQDLEGLDGYRGRPLSNNGTNYAYRVTQEPD